MDYRSRLLDKVGEEDMLAALRSAESYQDLERFTRRLKDSKALTVRVIYWYLFVQKSSSNIVILRDKVPDTMVSNFCSELPIDGCNIFYDRLKNEDIDTIQRIAPRNAKVLLQNHPYYKEKYGKTSHTDKD